MSSIETARDDYFDTQLIEVLYAMDHHVDIQDFLIDSVRSEREEHDSKFAAKRINRLAAELGIIGTAWLDNFVTGEVDNVITTTTIGFSPEDKLRHELHNTTIGEYLTVLTYDKLPIEWSDEGDCTVSISLSVGTDYLLNLKGEGRLDTSYLYTEPVEGDIDDTTDEDDMADEVTESEMHYEMTFKANLVTLVS